jgi:outer membrane immunogenic protein
MRLRYLALCVVFLAASAAAPTFASAADLSRPAPVYKAPPPAPPAFSWTGLYFGGNLGGAWGSGNVTDSLLGFNFGNNNSNGVFVGGGQVGANYQINNVVLGVEGDFDWAANNNNVTGGVVIPGIGLGHTFAVNSNNTWITTLAGRLGIAYDHWLFYGKGGAAWVGNNGFTVTDVTTGLSLTGTNNNSNTGWVAGGGVEWAFANNWTAKIEYDYIGLSNRTFVVPLTSPVLAGDTFTLHRNIQMVTVGINYLFNWGGTAPVTARY